MKGISQSNWLIRITQKRFSGTTKKGQTDYPPESFS